MPRYFCLHCADRLGHDNPRTVSNLLYVCRSTYQDCWRIFYGKAVLEIAPLCLPGHLTSDLTGSVDQSHLLEYAFLPENAKTIDPHRLRVDPQWKWHITALWTLRNLNPQEIHISAPMTEYLDLRHRHRPSAYQPMHQPDTITRIRAIYDQEIWATHASLQPESGKVELVASATTRSRCRPATGGLPGITMHSPWI
jgi:hypothetical protein